ncbi:hypothetical protein [Leptospira sp. GIMC2001]|uniref:hypothetical protein n=1 Tax=Leptospira sp. GIMC2001 TaxID=1513297 RepID=UPI002349098F|nr:hypothetical protein [Leptospira sp. GIMC2001]WCL51452.1 hypothetical protein O4O04_20260 [Leptospira sp. GIMC2001]
MRELEKHQFNLYPEMGEAEKSELVKDMELNGFDPQFAIVLFEGKVLDGWNRYLAAQESGKLFKTREFVGDRNDALLYTIRTNKRRDLTQSQKAILATNYKPLLEEEAKARSESNLKNQKPKSGNSKTQETKGKVNKVLAQQFDTSETSIKQATKLKKENPKLLKQVEEGKMSLGNAVKKHRSESTPAAKKSETKAKSKKAKSVPQLVGDLAKVEGIHKNMENSWKTISQVLAVHLDGSLKFHDEIDKYIPDPGKDFLEIWQEYSAIIQRLRSWCADKAVNCNRCKGSRTMFIDNQGKSKTLEDGGKPVKCPYCMHGLVGR